MRIRRNGFDGRNRRRRGGGALFQSPHCRVEWPAVPIALDRIEPSNPGPRHECRPQRRRRSCVLFAPSNAPSSTFDALRRRAAHRRTHLRQPSNAPADPAWHRRACASSTVDAPWTHRRAPAATVERSTGHRRARQRQTSNAHHVADKRAQVARRTLCTGVLVARLVGGSVATPEATPER